MKRFKTAIALGAVALCIAGAAPMASAGSSLCVASRACIYDQADFYALLASRGGGGGAVNVATAINDKMSSWENKTSSTARWHTDANSSGTCYTMGSKKESSYVGVTPNDKLTSWATNGGC